jgi:predicted Rossmann fold nucleotide-binding protein DprA/Smf involved in DNA uptake
LNAREQGFLLLTGFLGDPSRKRLSVAQFRQLALRARELKKPAQDRDMTEADLLQIGYDRKTAQQILTLLSQKEQLLWYVQQGRKRDCFPITRISSAYPRRMHHRLGLDSPSVLWAKGDVALLQRPAVALVGSRDLQPENEAFAREVGRQAALQGYVLISGNARGADQAAQNSCLEHGGDVISVVADPLQKHALHKHVLYLAEDGFDIAFSAHRALERNRVIHCLAEKTFVAQSGLRGGTWDGTTKNLQKNWSSVFCFDDGSAAFQALVQMGATPVAMDGLSDLSALENNFLNFIDQ